MTVLEAVRGWETLAGFGPLPHINDMRKDDDGKAGTATGKPKTEEEDEKEGF
jgi:protein kinase C substrate 80K-H